VRHFRPFARPFAAFAPHSALFSGAESSALLTGDFAGLRFVVAFIFFGFDSFGSLIRPPENAGRIPPA